MRWETYKAMTKEQKEEYDYKFRRQPVKLKIDGLATSISAFLAFGVIIILIFFIIVTDERFSEYKIEVQEMLQSSALIIGTTGYIILGFLIFALIQLIVKASMEYWWIRKNKIKIHYWWKKK